VFITVLHFTVPVGSYCVRGRGGRDGMQSVSITTKVLSSTPAQARCTRYNIMYNWPPRYNWNIVESGVKHHKTNHTLWTVLKLSGTLYWASLSFDVSWCIHFHFPDALLSSEVFNDTKLHSVILKINHGTIRCLNKIIIAHMLYSLSNIAALKFKRHYPRPKDM
jgi:hypothetical protein